MQLNAHEQGFFNSTPVVPIQRLPHAHNLPVPSYGTSLSAGLDLSAATDKDLVLQPGARCIVPTGFAFALPEGYEAQIRSRSGLAAKNGIAVLNSPGTIDADYRGEVKVILINLGQEEFTITHGMRIAQMVIAQYTQIQWHETATLDETQRGAGGFGSTGLSAAVSAA
jgi:dUTP pyrophosphatase